jgi:hypothetical protein
VQHSKGGVYKFEASPACANVNGRKIPDPRAGTQDLPQVNHEQSLNMRNSDSQIWRKNDLQTLYPRTFTLIEEGMRAEAHTTFISCAYFKSAKTN